MTAQLSLFDLASPPLAPTPPAGRVARASPAGPAPAPPPPVDTVLALGIGPAPSYEAAKATWRQAVYALQERDPAEMAGVVVLPSGADWQIPAALSATYPVPGTLLWVGAGILEAAAAWWVLGRHADEEGATWWMAVPVGATTPTPPAPRPAPVSSEPPDQLAQVEQLRAGSAPSPAAAVAAWEAGPRVHLTANGALRGDVAALTAGGLRTPCYQVPGTELWVACGVLEGVADWWVCGRVEVAGSPRGKWAAARVPGGAP